MNRFLTALLIFVLTPFPRPSMAVPTREQVITEIMRPYSGPATAGIDPSTLTGKVMCGYQGWHAAEGDGLGRGWYQWQSKGELKLGAMFV